MPGFSLAVCLRQYRSPVPVAGGRQCVSFRSVVGIKPVHLPDHITLYQ